ncbi:MAG: STAS domain-containing protein [Planctomycetes bacterium]|nr:STAS domain-containing protein [Planctomycetota bacterium]
MNLSVSHHEGYILATISGPIEHTAKELFHEHLHPLVGQSGTKLVIDLADSLRVNSEGLSQLIRLVTYANTKGSRVIFTQPGSFITNVLGVTRLDGFLEVTDTLSEAIERLGATSW